MYVQHLSLANYRNYARLELDLQPRVHVLQGDNAQGKTNLLESIYYLATTRSPLASADAQLIGWDADREPIPFARIGATYVRGGDPHTLEVTLVREPQAEQPDGGRVLRRQILLDGVARRAMDAVGKLNVVLFLPEDIGLVTGGPSSRRHYLDVTLCQIDSHYCRTLSRYNHVLTQRNALLRQIREAPGKAGELDYWDDQIVALGSDVLTRRLRAVRQLNGQLRSVQPALTEGHEHLRILYCDSLGLSGATRDAGVVPSRDLAETDTRGLGHDACLWEDSLREALQRARPEELVRAVTTVGPHRDDLRFLVTIDEAPPMDATVYGSRGQQRTVALAVKLAEVQMMQGETGEMPVLLLDDVLSELDQRRARLLLRHAESAEQVLITTTALGEHSQDVGSGTVFWRIVGGAVYSCESGRLAGTPTLRG